MSANDVGVEYFAVGDNGTPAEVRDRLSSTVRLPAREHDLLAQVLNDRYTDVGLNHSVQYSDTV